LDITDFKLRRVNLPVGMTDEEINRTPVSDYNQWEIKEDNNWVLREFGGAYYKSQNQSILSQITEMLLTGRVKDKQKMKILEQHQQGITEPEEISKKAEMSLEDVMARLDEITEEGYSHDYYESAQLIKKIRANSLYGALGNRYFHLYNLLNAINVTLSGQHLIKFLSDMFNNYFKDDFWKDTRYFSTIDEANRCKKPVVCLIDTDSVTGDTLIPIRYASNPTEDVDVYIEDIIKSVRPEGTKFESLNFEKYHIGNYSSNETLFTKSINRDTGKLEYKQVEYIYRHKVKKEMFEISIGDKTVTVTGDHSIIVLRDGEYIDVKPKDIQPGDELTYLE
jgi:DNA-binding Lrp family transcriptional regulator